MKSFKNYIFIFVLAFLSFLFPFDSTAQNKNNLTRVLFIFDASQSMYAQWDGSSRMEIAKELLSNMLDSLDNKKILKSD